MEFQTPFPTIGGFVGQQPPPMTPTPPITVDMTAAVAVAGVLNSNSQRAAHAETVTKPTSVPKKKKKKINTTSKRKVKPSVIIVKKIIPLSTTTVV
jgi:hypothetical protein